LAEKAAAVAAVLVVFVFVVDDAVVVTAAVELPTEKLSDVVVSASFFFLEEIRFLTIAAVAVAVAVAVVAVAVGLFTTVASSVVKGQIMRAQ